MENLSNSEKLNAEAFISKLEQELEHPLSDDEKVYQAIIKRSAYYLEIFYKERLISGKKAEHNEIELKKIFFNAKIGPDNKTPLELALSQKALDIMVFVLKHAPIPVELQTGIVEYAITEDKPIILKILHTRDISLSTKLCNGKKTPIKLALEHKKYNCMLFLLKKYPIPNKLISDIVEDAILNQQLEILKSIDSKGISLTSNICHQQKKPLEFAYEQDDYEIINFLLSFISIETENLKAIICDAVSKNQVQTLKTLVERQFSLDVLIGKQARTPLHIACKKGHLEMVEFLLSLNHEIQIEDKKNKTPYDLAFEFQRVKICDLLFYHQAQMDLADTALKNPEKIKKFISNYNELSIYYAIILKRIDVLKTYSAIELNQSFAHSKTKITPLHLAAQMNLDEICLALINCDIDINVLDSEGNTPLHLATRMNHPEVVKILLANYAHQHLPNFENDTALKFAWKSNNLNLYLIFLERLFDVNQNFFQASNTPLSQEIALELQKKTSFKKVDISKIRNGQNVITSFFQQYQSLLNYFHDHFLSKEQLTQHLQGSECNWAYDDEHGPKLQIKALTDEAKQSFTTFKLSLRPTPSQLGNLFLHDCSTYYQINLYIQNLLNKENHQKNEQELIEMIINQLKQGYLMNLDVLQQIYPTATHKDLTHLNKTLFLVYYLEPLRRLTKDKIFGIPNEQTPPLPIAIANAIAFELIRKASLTLSQFLSAKKDNYNPASGHMGQSLSSKEGYMLALKKLLMLEEKYFLELNPPKVNRRFYLQLLLKIYTELDDKNTKQEANTLDGYDSSDEGKADKYKKKNN